MRTAKSAHGGCAPAGARSRDHGRPYSSLGRPPRPSRTPRPCRPASGNPSTVARRFASMLAASNDFREMRAAFGPGGSDALRRGAPARQDGWIWAPWCRSPNRIRRCGGDSLWTPRTRICDGRRSFVRLVRDVSRLPSTAPGVLIFPDGRSLAPCARISASPCWVFTAAGRVGDA